MKVLLVAPVAPDANGSGAIPVLLAAELLGLRELHEVTLVTAIGDEPGEAEAVARLRDGHDVHIADRRRPPAGIRRLRRQARMAGALGAWRLALADRLVRRSRTAGDHRPGRGRAALRRGRRRGQRDVRVPLSGWGGDRLHAPRGPLSPPDRPTPAGAVPVAALGLRRARLAALGRFQRRAWGRFDRVQVFSRRDAETVSEQEPAVAGRVRVNPFGIVLPPAADPAAEVAGTRPLRRQLRPPAQPRRGDLAGARDHAAGAGFLPGRAAARRRHRAERRGAGAGGGGRRGDRRRRRPSSRTSSRRRWSSPRSAPVAACG